MFTGPVGAVEVFFLEKDLPFFSMLVGLLALVLNLFESILELSHPVHRLLTFFLCLLQSANVLCVFQCILFTGS